MGHADLGARHSGAGDSVPTLVLRPGHVQPVWAGHPWVFTQALKPAPTPIEAGSEVRVLDVQGNCLGRGLYSPGSALAVRLYTRKDEPVDRALIQARIARAIERRKISGLPDAGTSGFRLIHAEGDGLPGVIVDRFRDVLAVQWGSIGIKQREAWVLDALTELLEPRAIVERTSQATARLEGFEAGNRVIRGDESLTHFEFSELGLAYSIPLTLAQKTGYYFDQRPLRARIKELSRGLSVLDTYTYVGSLARAAAAGGAQRVVGVDSSRDAIEVAKAQLSNDSPPVEFQCADAQSALSAAAGEGGYDLVICDPPKLAKSRKSRDGALGLMRQLIGSGVAATRERGTFVICSCSAAIGVPELMRATALGARDQGREIRVLERVFQGADHPVPAAFPEGLYLTTLICAVD